MTHRAKGFFLDDTAVTWRVVNYSRLNEEALALCNNFRANSELVALRLSILEHVLHLLVLHLVSGWVQEERQSQVHRP